MFICNFFSFHLSHHFCPSLASGTHSHCLCPLPALGAPDRDKDDVLVVVVVVLGVSQGLSLGQTPWAWSPLFAFSP